MPAIRAGSRVLATEHHGFTPLEVENVSGDEVTVLVDPRVGVQNVRATFPRGGVSHVLVGSTWEHVG
ncbi:hypothetical protein ACT17_14790 [Mycolicibacterium conceptionense]|uniref:Uncharacterized protein n=1 Tax=Mycolicibacterium conceptionense TaxID=451644 RepID=A0A0J8U821_9MYCO|nr:hypothetical protein [Mycolicibacterium conceptionense]KMV17561.1 hypothetical protein ACT17_14790 [Mycolicibacterium conceptionense]